MSLKQIILFLIFALLSIYTAFLNPHDSVVHITQSQSIKLPTVLLLLGSILAGVIATVFMFWTFNFQNAVGRWKIGFKNNRIQKKNHKVEELFKKAENFFICGKSEKAQSLTEKVLDSSPDHVSGLNLMGKILLVAGHHEQAGSFHKKALAHDPQNIHILHDLADAYSKTGNLSEEIAVLQKIQRMNPGTVSPIRRLREVYKRQNDWKQVCLLQKRILPLVRDNNEELKQEQANLGQFLVELGKQYLTEGKKDSAISELKQAIRVHEQCLPAYLSLGDAYLESDKQKQALKTWQTGFQKTGNLACLVRSQIALRESENYQELMSTYEETLEASKDKSVLVLLLSTLYLEHDMEDKAQQLLNSTPSEHTLLHALLLENGPQFTLTRDAIFALA